MSRAMILDIHRNSLEDGPGIRTTVFLKGCPMKCIWCHNPESINPEKELAYLEDKCEQCFACVTACPNQVHSVIDETHHLDRSLCELCGKCVDACLYDALRITGKEMNVYQVMEIVIKDLPYYGESNGGLTVSGGEPMLQFEFTLELLQTAKRNGIHTCLDTSGLAPQKQFEEIFPFVDMFLFDYKATNPGKHVEFTKASNHLINQNFDLLYNKGARIDLRCPLVPGVNDDPGHLKRLQQIKQEYPKLDKITILPYHNTGNAKYFRYGYVNPLPGIKTADENKINYWNSKLK